MFDAPPLSSLQRAHGRAFVAFGGGRLKDLGQEGSAKVLLPRVAGAVPEVVFLNTSGGLTGGDRLEYRLQVGGRVAATTQTAERAYRSHHGSAAMAFRATVAAGGRLDWLPQETILYQDSDLQRETGIDLEGDAEVLLCEGLVLGRHAMGEVLTRAALTDRRMVRRDGAAVWAEGFFLTPEALAHPGLLAGAAALGVVALVARGAEDAPAIPAVPGARVAFSAWDGRAILRIAAESGLSLRRQLAAAITQLSGRALPRVWASGGL